jgi:peptidyl-prolyl cis-trans isomerase C
MTLSRPLGRAAAVALLLASVAIPAMAQTAPPAAPAPAAAAPAPADPVLARVDGVDIKLSDVTIAEEDLGSGLPSMTAEQKRDYLTTFLVDMRLVAKAAEERRLQQNPDFERRMSYYRQRALMEILLTDEATKATTDEAIRKVYQEEVVDKMKGQQEVRARHILVENEDEAKKIIEELKAGGDFAAIAKAKSKDPGGQDGGDLGFFVREQMVPEFATAAFNLKPGETTQAPVRTQFGWHVIRVEERRDRPVPALEQLRDQIEAFLVRRAQGALVTRLREGAKIERVEAPAQPR